MSTGDSTQFLIDMAAKLTGGTVSVATLGELGDKMLLAGSSAQDFEKIIKQTSTAVTDSAAAMKTSNDELAVGQTKYDELETSVNRASKAVERINSLVEEQGAKLAAAQKAGDTDAAERASEKMQALGDRQSETGKKAEAAAISFKEAAVALDVLKAKAAAADKLHESLSAGLKNVQGAAEKAKKAEEEASGSGSLKEFASGLGKIGGPAAAATEGVINLAEGFKKLIASLGSVGGYVAIGAAILAIASATIVATIAIAKWGIGLADTSRSQTLLVAGVARTVAGGEQLQGTLSKLSNIVPQSSAELLGMASNLANAGLRGKDLSNALEVAAVKAAKLKWGPDFQKQLLSLDVQTTRLHDNIAETFGGLKIDGLLSGVQTLVALFDSTTESGKALKFLFEAMFQPVIEGAAAAVPKVERLFLYAEILALKAYIALKPYRSEIEAVGHAVLVGAAVLGGVFAVALALVIGLVGMAVAGFAEFIDGFVEMPSEIVAVAAAIGGELSAVLDDIADIGPQMIEGLINGITDGAADVAKALTGVVSGAVDSAEKFLGIKSPSTRLRKTGKNSAEGYTGGVEDGSDDAQKALVDMVSPPPSNAGAGARASTGGNTINVTINIEGRGQPDESLAEMIEEKMRDLFDSDSLMLGGGEEPAT
jgi:hypothetical protein